MKIKEIEIFAVQLPFAKPFAVSYTKYETMPSVIVKVTTDDGIVGFGEGVPDEYVTGETWESTYYVLKNVLGPAVLGEDPCNFERLHDVMEKQLVGAPTAKAAIDIACHDIAGKKLGVPVYTLLGGRYHEKFPVTAVLSMDSPENMAEEAKLRKKEGYRSFKIKVGSNIQEDVKRIQLIKEAIGEEAYLRIDVNQGWETEAKALTAIRMLKNLPIDWIEQPVLANNIDALANIRQKTDIPIMADEALLNTQEMRDIIQKKAADRVNIKLMKCGGLYPGMKLAHMAEMAGIECQVGSMVESSISSSAGLHLAFSKKIITSVEITGPLKFSKDVGNLHYDIPYISLPEKPGLGIDVNENVLNELTEMKTKLSV